MPTVAERMHALFAGHPTAHGTHGVPEREAGSLKWGIKKTAKTVRSPVTDQLWAQHLAGTHPLGVIPIRGDSTVTWGCIDVDSYDENLLDLVRRIEADDLPLVACRSKSGGLHLFMFLAEPQSAGSLQAVLRDLAASLGRAGSEIFPKQTQILEERGDFGNWMVMPYFGGDFGGKLRQQVGLRKTGAELTVEEFLNAAENARLSPQKFNKLVATPRRSSSAPRSTKNTNSTNLFEDGPPCLQHMSTGGFPEGGRSSSLLMIGIYLKRRNASTWKQELEDANRLYMKPPLSSDEVMNHIRSLEKKDYEYTCKTEPMAGHCDSHVCLTRRFGVGGGGAWPSVAGLSKLNTDPPIWFVDVGESRLELKTEELQNYVLFHRVAMEKANVCYRAMKQSDWLMSVGAAMQQLTLVDAAVDVSEVEQFRELLEEFLTNRTRGEVREDLLNGRPWEDQEEKRHYFRLKDLIKFLKRELMSREVPKRGELTRRIEKLGGGSMFFNEKGKGINCWWVPSSVVSGVPESTVRKVKGVPI